MLRVLPASLSTVGRIVIIDSPVTDHSLAQQPAPAPQARAQLQTLPPSVTDLSAPAGAARTRRRRRQRGEPPRRSALDETRHTRSFFVFDGHTQSLSGVKSGGAFVSYLHMLFARPLVPREAAQLERSCKPWLESSIEQKETGRAASDWLVATTGRRLWRFADVFAERNA